MPSSGARVGLQQGRPVNAVGVAMMNRVTGCCTGRMQDPVLQAGTQTRESDRGKHEAPPPIGRSNG